MITIAIVEDNIYHLNMVSSQLEKNMKEDHILKTYKNADEYIKALVKEKVEFDIVIMDIELDKKSGIDLAIQTNILSPFTQIIFVTAYIDYASDVYESKHTYFISKEKIEQYLPIALEKTTKNIRDIKSQFIHVSWNKQKFELSQKDIIYAERVYRTTYIYTRYEVYKTSKKISELLSMLNNNFCTCHKSIIVNLNYVKNIEKNSVILKINQILPISRSQRDEFKKKYNRFLIEKNI